MKQSTRAEPGHRVIAVDVHFLADYVATLKRDLIGNDKRQLEANTRK